MEATHQRDDVARLGPAPRRELLVPADQVGDVDLERPLLAEQVRAQAVAVEERLVLAELAQERLQLRDRVCVGRVGVRGAAEPGATARGRGGAEHRHGEHAL